MNGKSTSRMVGPLTLVVQNHVFKTYSSDKLIWPKIIFQELNFSFKIIE